MPKFDFDNPDFVSVTVAKGPGGSPYIWGPSQSTDGGFVLAWTAKGIGFGEITFSIPKGRHSVVCQTEGMGTTFIRKAVEHFFSTITYENK